MSRELVSCLQLELLDIEAVDKPARWRGGCCVGRLAPRLPVPPTMFCSYKYPGPDMLLELTLSPLSILTTRTNRTDSADALSSRGVCVEGSVGSYSRELAGKPMLWTSVIIPEETARTGMSVFSVVLIVALKTSDFRIFVGL